MHSILGYVTNCLNGNLRNKLTKSCYNVDGVKHRFELDNEMYSVDDVISEINK